MLLVPCLPLAWVGMAGKLFFFIRQKGLMYFHVQILLLGVLLSLTGVTPA